MDKIRLFLRLLASVLFSGPQMLTKADAYLAAWNERDVAAILKQTGNGSYQDPLTQEPVQGDALREHIVVLLTAFPDLQFELQGEITAGRCSAIPLASYAYRQTARRYRLRCHRAYRP